MNDTIALELTKAFAGFAKRELGMTVPDQEVLAIVRDVLFTSRELYHALGANLVTTQEVAGALAGHIHVWLSERSGRSLSDLSGAGWADLINQFENILLSTQGHAP